jgi:beta-N-acetylhexosaminidase
MLGVSGPVLAAEDRQRLRHPLVGAVILFAQNYESPAQLAALTGEIRGLREPALLVAVDHEGGRVQRFREGFTAVPPMRTLGCAWDADRAAAEGEARRWGRLIAGELSAHGVDFSFTPVLDLDHGESGVIGDRAFHRDPQAVARLAGALAEGLREGGMAAVGKHFPGHGYVRADSHLEVPVDERDFAAIERDDLVPFAALAASHLAGIMPAHVIYPAVDGWPAGYSAVWLREILRGRLGFDGMVFSDDLGMVGAHGAGDIVGRADAALAAGCDVVLTCNDPGAADDLLGRWKPVAAAGLAARWRRMERAAARARAD